MVEVKKITICIGAICENGNKLIILADRTVTVTLEKTEFTQGISKLLSFDDTMIVAGCGRPICMEDILFKGREILSEKFKGEKTNINRIRSLTDAYYFIRKNKIEEEILHKHLLTQGDYFKYYGKGFFWEKQALTLVAQIESYDLELGLLVGAVDNTGASIYEVTNPGTSNCYNFLGYHAIGAGKIYAYQKFISNEYKKDFPLKKALFIAFEAKKNAEKGFGVGKKTDIKIISKNKSVSLEDEMIKKINEILEEKNTEIKNQNERYIERLENLDLKIEL